MYHNIKKTTRNEHGFVLVAAMVFLIALTLIGILAINNSSFERLLGGNERLEVETFYKTDSGIAAAIGLLGANFEMKGFSAGEALAVGGIGFDPNYTNYTFYMDKDTQLESFFQAKFTGDKTDQRLVGRFFGQFALGDSSVVPVVKPYRDAWLSRTTFDNAGRASGQPPVTSLKIDFISTTFANGTGIQSNEGYHHLGSGVGSGGAYTNYNIRARHDNINNAVDQMLIEFRHVVK